MPPRCTCGAHLPDDARFCHKCGKPQYEEDIARLTEQESLAAPVQPPGAPSGPPPSRIGFGNLQAVLITMAVAAFSLVLLCLAFVLAPPLGPIVLCGAGFAAAKFYKSRNPAPLSTGGGAFLGLMTGFWLFLVMVISAAVLAMYVSSPDGRDLIIKAASIQKMPEIAKLLDNPHQFVVNEIQGLIPVFFIATISAAFGGMLAARSSTRRRQPSQPQ